MSRIRVVGIAVVIAALGVVAIASTASGGGDGTAGLAKQLKKLKKQVAAIQKQQGPAGAPGTAGTARAYGTISPACTPNPGPGPADICTATKAKGISSVTRDGGNYCVNALRIDPSTTSISLTVDWGLTSSVEGLAQVMAGGVATNCSTGFQVRTERLSSPAGAVTSGTSATVGFTIVIP